MSWGIVREQCPGEECPRKYRDMGSMQGKCLGEFSGGSVRGKMSGGMSGSGKHAGKCLGELSGSSVRGKMSGGMSGSRKHAGEMSGGIVRVQCLGEECPGEECREMGNMQGIGEIFRRTMSGVMEAKRRASSS